MRPHIQPRRGTKRFYTGQHQHYCGIDLHARTLYLCILNAEGNVLLRGGILPMACVYPAEMRSTRDLLQRRGHFVRKRGQLFAHIQNTFHRYNLPRPPGRLVYRYQRAPIPDAFDDPILKKSVETDQALCDTFDKLIRDLEKTVVRQARDHDPQTLLLLNTISGIGDILSLRCLMRSMTS